ncbi:hypothetical protein NQ318_023573 [Aromia moschata]|uniref:Uncharacterized protein n=1 Tax=Aromia moschata TaxID=1265417 RepID=A0AAV8YS12_9CUCU|nr:hypothetical protein NQ318_023573 [Aromia moschata]
MLILLITLVLTVREYFEKNCVARSQTFTACKLDPANVISKLNVKEACTLDSYLKKHRKERSAYTCSNRMRELSRLLIAFRNIVKDDKVDFERILIPRNFELIDMTIKKNIPVAKFSNASGYKLLSNRDGILRWPLLPIKICKRKKWNKPLLLPLVSDIKIFREEAYKNIKL